MLKVSSWLETARYERFLGKKQHIMGIIGGRIVMLWSVLQTRNSILEPRFAKEERGELKRFTRKILYVETPYRAEATYW